MSSISNTTRTNVDFLEDLANYLTIQLVQHGGTPLKPGESVSVEDLKKALETIEKNLSTKDEDSLPLKTVPEKNV